MYNVQCTCFLPAISGAEATIALVTSFHKMIREIIKQNKIIDTALFYIEWLVHDEVIGHFFSLATKSFIKRQCWTFCIGISLLHFPDTWSTGPGDGSDVDERRP